jgi:hypothetical protein
MEVNRKCINYIAQTVIMVGLLNMLGLLAMRQWGLDLVFALSASMMFVLIVDIATILIWRWVVLNHKDMLPSFFTGVSGFRFLGALLMLLIGYLTIGQSGMQHFIVVFFVYYLVSIIHHSIFFSRVSNRV